MHFCVSAITSLPKLWITHCSQEVCNLFSFIFLTSGNLESINLLENLSFFVEKLFQSQAFFFFIQIIRSLDFLCFIKSPSFELIVQNFEVFALLRVHTSFNLHFPFGFFFSLEFLLSGLHLSVFIVSEFPKCSCSSSRKPCSDSTLNVEGGVFSLLCPHGWTEVLFVWSDDLIVPAIDVQPSLFAFSSESNFHLAALFAHHNCWFSFVLICLDFPWFGDSVCILSLMRLSKSMVVSLSSTVISETSIVLLVILRCFLNFDCYSFNLQKQVNKLRVLTWLSCILISTSKWVGIWNSSVSSESK